MFVKLVLDAGQSFISDNQENAIMLITTKQTMVHEDIIATQGVHLTELGYILPMLHEEEYRRLLYGHILNTSYPRWDGLNPNPLLSMANLG